MPDPQDLRTLVNRSFEIDPEDKPLYHALAAMAGNFTTLLWNKVSADFERRLDLPHVMASGGDSRQAGERFTTAGFEVDYVVAFVDEDNAIRQIQKG